ncbi:lactate utilization protein [Patescibacteria group bacterium]|nr:MAG: lactate utilization protein [Patescibacteria group bacterium]
MTYDTLATTDVISATMKALTERGFLPEVVPTGAEALARIKEIIPAGASVMNGSSRTLSEVGFVDYLKEGAHGWNNLHEGIVAEKDPAKQQQLRRQATLSEYFLVSVHALAQTGELVIASNSGSQLPHLAFTSPHLILVVGAQKITPDLGTALQRLNEYVLPLEDVRMKEVGMGGSFISKILILNREQAFMGRKVHVLIVNEKLGF